MALFEPKLPAQYAGKGAPRPESSACRAAARSFPGMLRLLAAMLPGLCGGGCDRAPSDHAGLRRGATVQVVNLSDYEWVVTLRQAGNQRSRTARLAPRARQTVVVPGGDYLVEQVAAGGELAAVGPRRFSTRLEAGETYRWPVTTLLSAEEGAEHSAGGAPVR